MENSLNKTIDNNDNRLYNKATKTQPGKLFQRKYRVFKNISNCLFISLCLK